MVGFVVPATGPVVETTTRRPITVKESYFPVGLVTILVIRLS